MRQSEKERISPTTLTSTFCLLSTRVYRRLVCLLLCFLIESDYNVIQKSENDMHRISIFVEASTTNDRY
jgi:hypothetical protein